MYSYFIYINEAPSLALPQAALLARARLTGTKCTLSIRLVEDNFVLPACYTYLVHLHSVLHFSSCSIWHMEYVSSSSHDLG